MTRAEGWEGWDQYAPFYDWENARTMGRQDVRFWQDLARREGGPVLELGCGTGRITMPVARTGVPVVGVDRSPAMLAYAKQRANAAAPTAGLIPADADRRSPPRVPSQSPLRHPAVATREADLAATLWEAAQVARPAALGSTWCGPRGVGRCRNRVQFKAAAAGAKYSADRIGRQDRRPS
jgi:SAM-dependent methyltransferase